MKKCPYCGAENETNHCQQCKAYIPEPEPKHKKPSEKAEESEKKE